MGDIGVFGFQIFEVFGLDRLAAPSWKFFFNVDLDAAGGPGLHLHDAGFIGDRNSAQAVDVGDADGLSGGRWGNWWGNPAGTADAELVSRRPILGRVEDGVGP